MTPTVELPRRVRFDAVFIRFACAFIDGLKVEQVTIYTA